MGGPEHLLCSRVKQSLTIFVRHMMSVCKTIVRIDAVQLYSYSICQPMPIGLHTCWDFDTEIGEIQTTTEQVR